MARGGDAAPPRRPAAAGCDADGLRASSFRAVTRHADVGRRSSATTRLFRNTIDSVLACRVRRSNRVARRGHGPIKTLIHMDGDEHRAYAEDHQRLVQAGEPAPERSEGTICRLARRYVDRMRELGGACDFAVDVALYYPLHVIMSILGVPETDEPRMLELTQKLFGAEDPDFGGRDGAGARWRGADGLRARTSSGMTVDRRARPDERPRVDDRQRHDRRRAARRPRDDQLLRHRRDGRTRHHVELARAAASRR